MLSLGESFLTFDSQNKLPILILNILFKMSKAVQFYCQADVL